MYLRLGPGDEVILPAISHVATAHAVEITGATPVFVDCNNVDGNIDTTTLAAVIGTKTKAICLVHFNGLPADMTKIMAIADAHGIPVLEDCAALGSTWDGKMSSFESASVLFILRNTLTPRAHVCVPAYVTEQVRRLRGFSYDCSLMSANCDLRR